MDEAEGSSVDANGGQGIQVGKGNVQHNNFFGGKGSVKSQGVTAVFLVALLAGGAIWGYRDYQQHAQSISGTTACQAARQDYIQYLQEDNDGEALNAVDAPFASEFSEQLSGAAGLTTASRLAAVSAMSLAPCGTWPTWRQRKDRNQPDQTSRLPPPHRSSCPLGKER